MRRSASEIIRNLEMRIARLENKIAEWKSSYTLTHKLIDDRDRVIATWKDTDRLSGESSEDAIGRSFTELKNLISEVEIGTSSITIEEERGREYSWGVEDHFTEELLDESAYLQTTLTFKGLSKADLEHIAHIFEE